MLFAGLAVLAMVAFRRMPPTGEAGAAEAGAERREVVGSAA
ncbi:hypothetical protein ACFQX7_26825 [Luedemannella flava]